MTHEFTRAEVIRRDDGVYLCLRVTNAAMARNEVEQLKHGTRYAVEVKRLNVKRSKQANAYYWTLCGKLAAKLGQPKDEVYRNHVRDVGENFRIVQIAEYKPRQEYMRLWEALGLGYVVDEDGDTLYCYYGSSTYDTKQMARLIDLCVQDCKAVEVETLPPERLAGMVQDWKPEKVDI